MKTFHIPALIAINLATFAFLTIGFAQTPGDFTTLTTNSNILGTGTPSSPSISITGAGTRMMWYPRKAAFRAGAIQSTEWNDINIGLFSTAFGSNSIASGNQSTAFGNGVIASGDSTTATGSGTKAQALSSTAIGRYNLGTGSPTSWVATDPIFEIGNGSSPTALSNALTVHKNGNMTIQGTITSANSLVLTSSSLSTALNTALNSATPPTSTAWKNAYVPKNSSATGSLALGSSQATGNYSFASGTASATGAYSSAHGNSVTASGSYSFANGFNTIASGSYSFSHGYNARASGEASTAFGETSFAQANYTFTQGFRVYANSMNEVVLGRAAQVGVSRPNLWYDHDTLFRLGNGDVFASYSSYSTPSDAITVLKNGHTTLGNKYWRRAVAQNAAAAISNPPSLTDNGGEALVVDGHTRLRGNVVIEQPQGDISMGIYGDDSSQITDNVIHGVIPLSSSGGSLSGSVQIDGRTISAHGIQFQDGGLDNGWFEENGQEVDPYFSGQPALLHDNKRLAITVIGEGGIGIAILPAP